MKFLLSKKALSCISALVLTISITSSISAPVYAVNSTCKTGMFLGYDGGISTTGVSTYSPDIVSLDYCNWNGSTGANMISYSSNSTVKNLGKTISVSCHMPNPKGGNVNTLLSASDFDILANQKIQNITNSSSTMLQTYKAEIDKIAAGLADLGTTVYYRPFHEMNYGWFWWGAQDTTDFKTLWYNLYDYIINYKKLTNVKFIYAPNKGDKAADYYPDSSTVTWIGIDAYSDDPANDSAIQTAYNALVTKGKPIGFSEIGPTVGGAYVNSNNQQLQKFDYSLWNNAINNKYTSASYFITWDGAYAPFNNTNGSLLFQKTSSSTTPSALTKYNFENSTQNWVGNANVTGPWSVNEWSNNGSYSLKGNITLSSGTKYSLYNTISDNYSGYTTLKARVKVASWGNLGSGLTAKLYVKTGSSYTWYDGGSVIVNTSSTTLTLNLTNITNISQIKEVGIEFIGGANSSGTSAIYVDNITLQ